MIFYLFIKLRYVSYRFPKRKLYLVLTCLRVLLILQTAPRISFLITKKKYYINQ